MNIVFAFGAALFSNVPDESTKGIYSCLIMALLAVWLFMTVMVITMHIMKTIDRWQLEKYDGSPEPVARGEL